MTFSSEKEIIIFILVQPAKSKNNMNLRLEKQREYDFMTKSWPDGPESLGKHYPDYISPQAVSCTQDTDLFLSFLMKQFRILAPH